MYSTSNLKSSSVWAALEDTKLEEQLKEDRSSKFQRPKPWASCFPPGTSVDAPKVELVIGLQFFGFRVVGLRPATWASDMEMGQLGTVTSRNCPALRWCALLAGRA